MSQTNALEQRHAKMYPHKQKGNSASKNKVLTATVLWLAPHGTLGYHVLLFPPKLTGNISSCRPPPRVPSPLWLRTHYMKLECSLGKDTQRQDHANWSSSNRESCLFLIPGLPRWHFTCSNKDTSNCHHNQHIVNFQEGCFRTWPVAGSVNTPGCFLHGSPVWL